MDTSRKTHVSEKFQKQLRTCLYIAVVVTSFLFLIPSFYSTYEIQNLHYIAEKVHAQSEFKSSMLFDSSETLEKLLELSWPQFPYL